MSTETPVTSQKPQRVNLRRPGVIEEVQAQVESHYSSDLVDYVRKRGNVISAGGLTVRLAKEFGFCYGVERAIDLAYAARKVFPDKPLFILGEIIHNQDVNDQIRTMGIRNLLGDNKEANVEDVNEGDIVIIPAFGTEVKTQELLQERGCLFVDTTCGDVMSVWKRVRQYSRDSYTSIIHGKSSHEETKATSSRAMANGQGHYLVVYNLEETDYVCGYIREGGNKEEFLKKFAGAYSDGFDPDEHLSAVGVANQTTMMRNETEEVQRRLAKAVEHRFGREKIDEHFRFFDTICGATQERQDALQELLKRKMDLLLVVGGYNSSNTSHLAEMGESVLPTYFIKNATKIESAQKILHFNQHVGEEHLTENWLPDGEITIGITAGASCPNNLIEDAIRRLFEFRGMSAQDVLETAD